MSLDGFSMHALVKELSRALIGGRIDKITQPNKQTIILSVRQPGRNYLLHITTNPANPAAHLFLPIPSHHPLKDYRCNVFSLTPVTSGLSNRGFISSIAVIDESIMLTFLSNLKAQF